MRYPTTRCIEALIDRSWPFWAVCQDPEGAAALLCVAADQSSWAIFSANDTSRSLRISVQDSWLTIT